MKLFPCLLAASLVANAALAFGWFHQRHDAASKTSDATRTALSPNATSTTAKTSKTPATATEFAEALRTNDLASVRDALRAAGLADSTVRNVINSLVWNRYHDRVIALQPKPDPSKPWWKNENNWQNMPRENRAELRRLQQATREESKRLLGPADTTQDWNASRLSFLPEAKRAEFAEVEQDYQDLIQEVQQDMQGFTLPSDTEKIRFLMEEQRRDLAALLTPQELQDYDLRMSPTAQQLKWKMTRFDGTEEEYRRIFALQKAIDDTRTLDQWGNPIGNDATDWKKRQEADKKLKEQIKDALGAERYADYLRSQNYEYQQLAAAEKRLSLPQGTARAIFDLRDGISAESVRIVDNPDLTPEIKKQELANLAKKTKDDIRARLGAEAADVYLKSAGWLNNVEQGQAVTFTENGSSSRGISQTARKAPAK